MIIAGPAGAQTGTFSPYSLTLDLNGQGAFGSTSNISFTGGVGGSLFGDWRLIEYLSIGTGFSFADYPGTKSWQAASWDVGGKVFPMGAGKSGELYIKGAIGYDLIQNTLNSTTPGNFHGNAEVGYSAFVLGPGMALDMGLKYDIYTPLLYLPPVHDVGIKVGVTWYFGSK